VSVEGSLWVKREWTHRE